jgi:cytochrome c biogenesis protein CcdA
MVLAPLALALTAGLLSTLSPCVLPLLPIVLGAALSEHRYGRVALAAGLALSFTAIGLFVATVGFSIGVNSAVFREAAAALLVAIGLVLLVPRLQAPFATAASPFGAMADARFGQRDSKGLAGQFMLGILLGAVWSPCVGPTLGAASLLAAQSRDLPQVAAVMASFGLGAALPLLGLGMLSREALLGMKAGLLRAGRGGKMLLGGLLVAAGLLIVTGLDKRIETYLVEISPAWLSQLTTSY